MQKEKKWKNNKTRSSSNGPYLTSCPFEDQKIYYSHKKKRHFYNKIFATMFFLVLTSTRKTEKNEKK